MAGSRNADARGVVMELYNAREMAALGLPTLWQQDNLSRSPLAFTLRGLHFQRRPAAQAKLVRVLAGAAFTVAVDLRAGSPGRGALVTATLTPDGPALFVPRGFAHGVLTLEPDTLVLMKLDASFSPGDALGLAYDDPALEIPWPLAGRTPLLAERDRLWPRLAGLAEVFA